MEPFRPIEANNNGQMVPQAESIWEGNYTNAAVARDAKQMLTAEAEGWKEHFMTSTSCVHLLRFYSRRHPVSGGEVSTKGFANCSNTVKNLICGINYFFLINLNTS